MIVTTPSLTDDNRSFASAGASLVAQGRTETLQSWLEDEAKNITDDSEFYSFMSTCIAFCPPRKTLECARLILTHAPKHLSWASSLEEAVQDNNLGVVQAICEFGNGRQEDLQYRSLIKNAGINGTNDETLRLLVTMAQDTSYKDVSLIMLGVENRKSLFAEFWNASLDEETRRVVMINLMVRSFVEPEILEIAYDHDLVERIVAQDNKDGGGTPLIEQHPYMKPLHQRHALTQELDGAGTGWTRGRKL